jgi:PPP family 3-phenylpropionic acid transporter
MGMTLAARLDTPVARTSHYYFVLLMTMAVSNPLLGIWLSDKGLTPEQIGIVNAMPFLVVTVLNQLVGRIADKASDWRTTIVIGSMVAAIGPFALFFVHDFVGIAIVWTITILPFLAIGPVIDAASIRMARRLGANFAIIRMWGSVGLLLATLLAGVLLDFWGIEAFLPLLAAVGVIRALVSLRLPLFRAPAPSEADTTAAPTLKRRRSPLIATRFSEVWRPWFLLPVIAVAIIHGSHMMQTGFGALLWKEAGVPDWAIGPLWALGPGGEIIIMLMFSHVGRRFSARHLILAAGIFTVLRWVGFALEPPLWGLFVLQLMNMVTFGLSYLGVVNFIANWTSEGIAAEAQSAFQAVRQVVTVVALTGFGYLVGHFGAGAYYGAAAMGAVAGGLTLISLFLMPTRHEQRQRPAHR